MRFYKSFIVKDSLNCKISETSDGGYSRAAEFRNN